MSVYNILADNSYNFSVWKDHTAVRAIQFAQMKLEHIKDTNVNVKKGIAIQLAIGALILMSAIIQALVVER